MKRLTAATTAIATLTVLATVACLTPAAHAATTFTADKAHTSVSFAVRHMMSQVRGSFTDFSMTIVKDDANLAGSSVDFRIQATSVNTASEMRDKHLRSEDFFFVEKFPEITVLVTGMTPAGENTVDLTATMAIRGATLPLPLTATINRLVLDGLKIPVPDPLAPTDERLVEEAIAKERNSTDRGHSDGPKYRFRRRSRHPQSLVAIRGPA